MGYPSVFPTGTTVYNPKKCWNGYTIYPAIGVGAVLVDMNGNISNIWEGFHGMPNKILPGGYVMGCTGLRNPKYGHQDHKDLVQVDWDGNTVWKFDKYEYIEDPGEDSVRSTKIKDGVSGFDQPIQECIESDALDGN